MQNSITQQFNVRVLLGSDTQNEILKDWCESTCKKNGLVSINRLWEKVSLKCWLQNVVPKERNNTLLACSHYRKMPVQKLSSFLFLGFLEMRISNGTAATCGMHTVQTHALQVIQEALHSLCAHCRDLHAHPTKCIPDWLDWNISCAHREMAKFFLLHTSFISKQLGFPWTCHLIDLVFFYS